MLFDPTLITIITAPIAALSALYNLYVAVRRKRTESLLAKEFGSELYPIETIRDATRFYVRPSCSSIDPAQEAEIRQLVTAEEDLFSVVGRFLSEEAPHRHLLLLADSGMGKSAFTINFYVHYKKRRPAQKITVIPLGIPDADDHIKNVSDKRNTILFLDAFDEDVKAIDNHVSRLQELMTLSSPFGRVLITCRTQFFSRDQEIPIKTGTVLVGPRGLGNPGNLEFWKLYLAPFNDRQVKKFIAKRYPFWQIWNIPKSRKARAIAMQIPYLNVRPMLLSHIPEILESGLEVRYSFQLYKIMVERWIKREGRWVETGALSEFSQRLAVDIYSKRALRGAERIPRSELKRLATDWSINLNDWQASGRSLLNRDGQGNYKFAHRSIMEYLFAEQAVIGNPLCRGVELTDQIKLFIWEICDANRLGKRSIELHLEGINLRGLQPALRAERYYEDLTRTYLWNMTRRCRLFDSTYNPLSPGRLHLYVSETHDDRQLIADLAAGLMWSRESVGEADSLALAQRVIQKLNEAGFASFSNWRLPSLEEGMSLLQPEKNSQGLHLDPLFGRLGERIITGDSRNGRSWLTSFVHGGCLEGTSSLTPFQIVPVRSL